MSTRFRTRHLAPWLLLLGAACSDSAIRTAPDARPELSSHTSGPQADVLILSTTAGVMQSVATELGMTSDIVTPTEWAAMSSAQFGAYKAIVLGDPNCVVGTSPIAAAVTNRTTWGPQVDGNTIVIGTDESLHASSGGRELAKRGLAFAAAATGKTGAYISLSCYYHGTAALTALPLLEPFGTFTATGVPGCFNDAYLTASHPALTGITNATVSGWGCSVHNAFDTWPASFEVLAIARNVGAAYTAPDGTQGTPYILARGEGVVVISDIALTPATATNPIGTSHTLTATVKEGTTPIAGAEVTFTVETGPHAGMTATATTNASGVATWSYTGTTVGTDIIRARFTQGGVTQTSNAATKIWVASTGCTAGMTKPRIRAVNMYSRVGVRMTGLGLDAEMLRWRFTDPNCGPWKVNIAWGDGMTSEFTLPSHLRPGTYNTYHAYAAPGHYAATIMITDATGLESDLAHVHYEVMASHFLPMP